MALKIFCNDNFSLHKVPEGHPERVERIITINKLIKEKFNDYISNINLFDAGPYIELVHSNKYLEKIKTLKVKKSLICLDADTYFSEGSYEASILGVCGVINAIDYVMKNKNNRAFVSSRPPGHHAEPEKAMGFCIFSNAAIAAKYALRKYELSKVAVLDFDVHHGNGTQEAFIKNPNLIYASTHEMPLFPGTGYTDEVGEGNIFNSPLNPFTETKEFISRWKNILLPKINDLNPDLIIISAGFDAHKNDPLSSVNLESIDFKNITDLIVGLSDNCCNGNIISILEGGYNLTSLKQSLNYHLNSLSKFT